MPLLASIDVGSNTIRLLIGRFENGRLIHVFSDRKMTRLGNMVDRTGKLQKENIEASVTALEEFSDTISKHGARHIKAVATSALREASNSDVFIQRVLEATSIGIEVIPGEKEAELTLKGILLAFPESECRTLPTLLPPLPGRGTGALFIVDIGGGSTEWILCRDGNIDMGSIPAGVIKLTQDFLKSDPISEVDLRSLNGEITSVTEDLRKKIGRSMSGQTRFVGAAGTFSTIASVDLGLDRYSREKIHLHRISLPRLREMSLRLLALGLVDRTRVKGLEPERADLIIPGILFTINIMESFRFDELIVSDYGLLEGVLSDIEKGISETGKS